MIVKAAEPEEYAEIRDMLDKAFKSELVCDIAEITTSKDANFQKGDLRVVEVDGKIVSMMMLIRRPLRFGTAIVNGAIIAPVATHPDYQGKGYCSAVMRDAVRYMKAQGFDITILWGIPWLYPHYGYSPAMVNTRLSIKPKQNSSVKKVPYEFRAFTEADLEQVTQIYHSNTAMKTCAEVRATAMYEWVFGGPDVEFEVLADEKGEIIGYCVFGRDWGEPCAHEIGVLNDDACRLIFDRLLERAKQKSLKEFLCIVHPEHPFTRFAFWHGGEIRIRGSSAGMARVLNLVSLLTKMEKEFERRLGYSEFKDLECALTILSEEEDAVLNINRGQVSVSTDIIEGDYQLDISLACLNPLITGCKDIRELLKNPHVKLRGGEEVIRLMEVLFPRGFPSGGIIPLVWE